MNEVNKTLFIPLYGKAKVSRMGKILKDPVAERIWEEEGFPIHGRARSKWLAYNMAMRARVFDDWTDKKLMEHENALVLQVGCGLDSRCERVRSGYANWVDCDLEEVIQVRRKYFPESETYHLHTLDASDPARVGALLQSDTAIVVLEGLSMYLTKDQLRGFLVALERKYGELHILMDVYTEFGAWASKYKNPVREVGVTRLYGVDDMGSVLGGLRLKVVKEHSFTPEALIEELEPFERAFFKTLFTGGLYRKIYRMYELEA